jgi:hypothetical protein
MRNCMRVDDRQCTCTAARIIAGMHVVRLRATVHVQVTRTHATAGLNPRLRLEPLVHTEKSVVDRQQDCRRFEFAVRLNTHLRRI